MRTLPELRDVASDQQNRGLRADLVIDRDTASRLGILPQAMDDTLYDAFGQRQVSTIFTQLNQYHVVLEVGPQFQQDPTDLSHIYVKSATGTQVPLSSFSHFETTNASLAINHQGQFPVVTISFNLAPGSRWETRPRPLRRWNAIWACPSASIPASREPRQLSRIHWPQNPG